MELQIRFGLYIKEFMSHVANLTFHSHYSIPHRLLRWSLVKTTPRYK